MVGAPEADLEELIEALLAEEARERAPRSRVTRSPAVAERLEDLWRSEPAPCDECRHARLCAGGLACEAFVIFVLRPGGWRLAPRAPRRDLYERCFGRRALRDEAA